MEAFKYQRELPPDDPEIVAGVRIQQLNKWPADRPLWRKTLPACSASTVFHMTCCEASPWPSTSKTISTAYLKPLTQVSILHYPPQQPADKAFGNRPHQTRPLSPSSCKKRLPV